MREEWHEIVKWGLFTHAGLLLGALVMLVLLSNMLRQQRSPAASAAWLVFMLAVPYIDVPLYLFIGTRKLKSLERRKQHLFNGHISKNQHKEPLQQLLSRLGVPDPTTSSSFQLHHDAAQAWESLLELVEQAHCTIDIEIFILGNDQTGQELLSRLTACARRGVQIRLLLDGVGSFLLSDEHLRPLTAAGAQIARFVPVLHIPLRGRTNLRNHRKLVVVDQESIWSGGRNIADDYLQPEGINHWLDLSFELSGPAALDYQAIFDTDWEFATHGKDPRRKATTPAKTHHEAAHSLQVIPSGPDMAEDVLEHTLVALINAAQRRIALITPYFVPSQTLQTLLCVTARSGIQLDIVLPERSNHRMADYVRNRFLRELEVSGASIQLLPDHMLHAKALLVDDRYALVGSANFDLRSLYLNFELTTLFYTPYDIASIREWADSVLGRTRAWQAPDPSAVSETLEGLIMITAFQL